MATFEEIYNQTIGTKKPLPVKTSVPTAMPASPSSSFQQIYKETIGKGIQEPVVPERSFVQKYQDFSDSLGDKVAVPLVFKLGRLGSGVLKTTGSTLGAFETIGRGINKYNPIQMALSKAFDIDRKEIDDRPLFSDAITRYGEKMDEAVNDLSGEEKDYWDYAVEGLGSSIPFLVGGLVGKAAGVSAALLNTGLSGTEALVNGYDDYKKLVTENDPRAKAKAAASFVSNLGVNYITNKLGFLNENTIPGVVAGLKRFMASTLLETGQESTQQLVSDLVTGTDKEKIAGNFFRTALISAPTAALFGGSQFAVPKTIEGAVSNVLNDLATEGVSTQDITITLSEVLGVPIEQVTEIVDTAVKANPEISSKLTVNNTIQNHINSANQTIELTAPEKLESLGGMKDVISRTKTNIVDQLKIQNQSEEAARIDKIDTTKISSVNELLSAITGKTLAPSKAATPEARVQEETKLGIEDKKSTIGKTELSKIISSSPEFKSNPVLFVDEEKNLVFEGDATKFKIKASALNLKADNLEPGESITVDVEALKAKGAAKGMRVYQGGETVAKEAKPMTVEAKTPDEFKKRIEQLNKFAQGQRILRRTRGLSKKAAGVFTKQKSAYKGDPSGEVRLQEDVVMNPKAYMETLSHELGHAMENALFGKTNTRTYEVFGEDLSADVLKTLKAELKAVTVDLEGQATVDAKPGYYNKPTELLARFFQKMFESPGNLQELAPTAMEMIYDNATRKPIIREFLDAAENQIDKAPIKLFGKELRPSFLPDYKQQLIKRLGEQVGNRVFDEMNVYRAMKNRAVTVIGNMLDSKFKGIKDSPELIFRAVEGIRTTEEGVPQFGTRDFAEVAIKTNETGTAMDAFVEPDKMSKSEQEQIKKLLDDGFVQIKDESGKPVYEIVDGKKQLRFAKERYSEEEARKNYEALTPEAKKLVDDFTSDVAEAKDIFNRDLIKEVYNIEGNIEGWVHHVTDTAISRPATIGGGQRFKIREAGSRKKRTGSENYIEDLKKAMSKALVDLEGEKAYNNFITRVFPMVTKPIAQGQQSDAGWTEVVGNIEKGVGTPQEKRIAIVDKETGKVSPAQQVRYQMPTNIYKKFQLLKGIAEEATTATKVMNSLNRYWQTNILLHPGSVGTNFISGGLQYGQKVMTDFYKELLTGDISMPQTRSNLYAMIQAITPHGWNKAPDFVYGGNASNFYGQFSESSTFDTFMDNYAATTLRGYGAVERYWKKVISLAEGVGDLENLNTLTKEGLRLPTTEEREMIAQINREVDLYGYDYDNVPLWMEGWAKNPVGAGVKPFIKYPYKYMKMLTNTAGDVFNRNLPWQDRTAKLLSLTTIIGLIAALTAARREEQKTPEGIEVTPPQLSPRGQLFIGKEAGEELFVRTAKYPFFNITNTGVLIADKNYESAVDSVTDFIGSVAPAGQLAAALLGFRNKYQTYTPAPVIAGDALASFVPGTRIFNDVARMFDPFQRSRKTFAQSFTSLIPLPGAGDKTLEEMRGKIKEIKQIPAEGKLEGKAEGKRTTIDVKLENHIEDVLLSFLSGIYVKRIDPDEAKAFIIREKKNKAKNK